ncbi:hypothetical protein CRG98_011320 [Punica granatum]|uniref:Uncharacterized protein n=1 Tax=Punica granatum TaxID=22663 RepID=A0A2I0KIY9_PUNGR|nr:hypothetical protein CRG98_011320 [Punica granatum]
MGWAVGPSWLSGLIGLLLGRRWECLLGRKDLGRVAESWIGPLWVAGLLAGPGWMVVARTGPGRHELGCWHSRAFLRKDAIRVKDESGVRAAMRVLAEGVEVREIGRVSWGVAREPGRTEGFRQPRGENELRVSREFVTFGFSSAVSCGFFGDLELPVLFLSKKTRQSREREDP